MLIKLSVKERALLLDFIPREGNIIFVKMCQDLLEDLSFSDDENKKLCFHQTTKGLLLWDEEAAENIEKEVDIPDTIKDQITTKLIRLNDKDKLTIDHICLYDRFIGSKS